MSDLSALAGATIVFDLDGTLVDTAPDIVGTINVILVQEGLSPLPASASHLVIGRGAHWGLERAFEIAGAPRSASELDQLVTRFREHYLAHIADGSLPFPGMVDAVTRLRAAGAKTVVCTNKITALSHALLDALDLSPLFDAIVGGDAVPAQKPDPRPLIQAITAVGGEPARAIMVGDAAPDAGAARAAGIPLILVSFGYGETPAADLGPDILIHHFDELEAACRALLNP
jgi:phosphoglycolate phosphatase